MGKICGQTLIQMLVYIFVCGNKMMSTNEFQIINEQMYEKIFGSMIKT